jgi:delta8-fatty-acid desaturase
MMSQTAFYKVFILVLSSVASATSTHHYCPVAGETLFVLRDKVIRVPDSWLSKHPGGYLPILHFVGRDATDEVEVYHRDESLKRMYAFAVGIIEPTLKAWEPLLPPIDNGWMRKPAEDGSIRWTQDAHSRDLNSDDNDHDHDHNHNGKHILLVKNDNPILCHSHGPSRDELEPTPTGLSLETQATHSSAFKVLHQRVIDAGLYQCPYVTGYGPEFVRYIAFATLSYYAYQRQWFFISSFALGLLWHQLVFFVHDLGHMGVTHIWAVDRVMSIFLADWVGGLSIGWWVHVRAHASVAFCLSDVAPLESQYTSWYAALCRCRRFHELIHAPVVTNHPSQYDRCSPCL